MAAWATARHVRLWLAQIGASPEATAALQAAGVDHLHKLLRIDAERLRRQSCPFCAPLPRTVLPSGAVVSATRFICGLTAVLVQLGSPRR